MSERSRVRRLERIYAEVPAIECKGLCERACGVILMTPLESRRLPLPAAPPAGLSCPHLAEGRCSTYDRRPLVCRLYGVAEGLDCPHGCERHGVLSLAEVRSLIHRVGVVGGRGVATTHPVLLATKGGGP